MRRPPHACPAGHALPAGRLVVPWHRSAPLVVDHGRGTRWALGRRLPLCPVGCQAPYAPLLLPLLLPARRIGPIPILVITARAFRGACGGPGRAVPRPATLETDIVGTFVEGGRERVQRGCQAVHQGIFWVSGRLQQRTFWLAHHVVWGSVDDMAQAGGCRAGRRA